MIKTGIKTIKSVFRFPTSKHWRMALMVLVMAIMLVAPVQNVRATEICSPITNGTMTCADNGVTTRTCTFTTDSWSGVVTTLCKDASGKVISDTTDMISPEGKPKTITKDPVTGKETIQKDYSFVTDIVGRGVAGILYYLLNAEGWFLGGAGTFADWMLQSGPITTSTVVLVGWGITRDLANMLFILILLGIALDYILFQSFGVKRALPTLIIVALLINFSLPIAGVLIDFANVFTHFFMSEITAGCGITEVGQECGFTVAIANNLNVTKLFGSGVGSNMIIDEIFAIFFMAGTTFVFLALGVMFLYRTGMLYALLILLPLVLALKPFPPTSKYFGQWSNYFIKWVMFAPAATFFLYLSMLVFQGNVGADAKKIFKGGINDGFIEQVYTYIIVWFFMLGSLMAAQSMGIKGASASLGIINGATNWAGGKIKGKIKGAGKAGLTAAGRKVGADKKMEDLAKGLQKIPGIGGILSSSVRGVASKTKTAMEKQEALTVNEKAKFEGLSDEALLSEYGTYMKSKIPGNKSKANYIASMLSQRKGNALTVKNTDGSVDEPATAILRRTAYDNSKAHGNRAVMDMLIEKDPRVKIHAINQKYAGKPANIVIDGKTKNEAERDYYRNIRAKDIAELPDSFFKTVEGVDLITKMMNERSITSSHLRTAMDENKHEFLDQVKQFILSPNIGGIGKEKDPNNSDQPSGLWKQNRSLAKYLTGDAGGEVSGFVL